jgi:SNF2 family DNA or RNA helicase
MQIVNNRAVLLKLRDPERVKDVIPSSEILSDSEILVKWGLDEVLILKNLKIDVPSPIQATYNWPGKFKPFAHQVTTAAFLTKHKRAFCFNEQGTGKTASAIWASDYLLSIGKIKRVLVVCPLSILDSAWRADLFTFAMHRTADVAYHSKAAKRREILALGTEYVIINYDGIRIIRDDIEAGGFDLIIADEGTHYKNPATDRWRALNSLIKPETWLWLMTGTPAAQSPVDAYGLAKLINPLGVPRFAGSFKDQVMRRVSQFKWVPKATATETVHRALQPAIRFTKEECLDLPEMVYVTRTVEMTNQQNKYYKRMKDHMVIEAAEKRVTAVNAAVNMGKLLQLSCGAVYTDDGDTLEFDIRPRYKVLREVIDESSKKLLIFVPFKHVIDLLMDKLTKDGITADAIHGGIGRNQRTATFKNFQTTDNPQVLVVQPRTAAHGLTLTAANTVVWWGPSSSLEIYLQANARVHRSGQTHKCTVVHLQGSSIERHIYAMLYNRIDIHTKVLDLYKKILD